VSSRKEQQRRRISRPFFPTVGQSNTLVCRSVIINRRNVTLPLNEDVFVVNDFAEEFDFVADVFAAAGAGT
jgi:hypothetical protein